MQEIPLKVALGQLSHSTVEVAVLPTGHAMQLLPPITDPVTAAVTEVARDPFAQVMQGVVGSMLKVPTGHAVQLDPR